MRGKKSPCSANPRECSASVVVDSEEEVGVDAVVVASHAEIVLEKPDAMVHIIINLELGLTRISVLTQFTEEISHMLAEVERDR